MGENRNVVLGGIAGVALLAAGFMYLRGGEPAGQVADVEAPATIKVSCAKCGESWEMPEAEYDTLKSQKEEGAKKIKCTKCGANEMWKASMSLALPVPEGVKPEGVDLNIINPTTEAEMNAPKKVKAGGTLRKE